ncbi:hypothetical protein ACOMHN_020176 [Nucella lapillus]
MSSVEPHVPQQIILPLVWGSFHAPQCGEGRSVITHLFEWRWDDIGNECERFLGPYGYCGVQISPATENAIVWDPYRPWWERYQPVSYRLATRSGDEKAFRDMVNRCHRVGVRIYADVVLNHNTGVGQHGRGTGGSEYDGRTLDYPGVPYTPKDFNDASTCPTRDLDIHNYNNPVEVRNCRLKGTVSLADLALDHSYVRGKVVAHLNHLLDLGVAGFRVDAAKHMWPQDLGAVFALVKNLRSDRFGAGRRPFVYQEVIDHGVEAIKADEYLTIGRVTNFKFGLELSRVFRGQNPMKWLVNWGPDWGMWDSSHVLNFIDNHDNQRGHGGGGTVLTHKQSRPYKLATAFMLAHPYGFPRVMSSYGFQSPGEGPPRDSSGNISHVGVNPNLSCSGGWVCEHRWRQIYNMVAFRNVAGGSALTHWWSGADYQIAFGRENKAFIAFNLERFRLASVLQTGLPQGTYCDVISGNMEGNDCSGKRVEVGKDGRARFDVCAQCADPMVAIHAGAKIGSQPRRIG